MYVFVHLPSCAWFFLASAAPERVLQEVYFFSGNLRTGLSYSESGGGIPLLFSDLVLFIEGFLMAKTVALLLGGWSAEREVSLIKGKVVEAALVEEGYTVRTIDVRQKSGSQG